jgi:hypothetical protein
MGVLSGFATLLAGGLLAFGAFRPWLLERSSATCVTAGATGLAFWGGQITLGFGVTALVLGGLMLGRVRPRLLSILGLILFVLAALHVSWVVAGRGIAAGWFGCPEAGIGSAIYISWVGAGLGIVGCSIGTYREFRQYGRDE